MKRIAAIISILLIAAFISGCGETVNGMVKDTKRIGKGIKTVFVRS